MTTLMNIVYEGYVTYQVLVLFSYVIFIYL